MLTAASMAINDYYDRAIDAMNEPSRPIPSGLVSAREALGLVFVLSVVGFVFAFLTSVLCLAVAVVSWVIVVDLRYGWEAYWVAWQLSCERLRSHAVHLRQRNRVGRVQLNVWLFARWLFFLTLGREITKGIVDVEGDEAEGVKTLAVRYGERNAALLPPCFMFPRSL